MQGVRAGFPPVSGDSLPPTCGTAWQSWQQSEPRGRTGSRCAPTERGKPQKPRTMTRGSPPRFSHGCAPHHNPTRSDTARILVPHSATPCERGESPPVLVRRFGISSIISGQLPAIVKPSTDHNRQPHEPTQGAHLMRNGNGARVNAPPFLLVDSAGGHRLTAYGMNQ